jgi:hypothetical protein
MVSVEESPKMVFPVTVRLLKVEVPELEKVDVLMVEI